MGLNKIRLGDYIIRSTQNNRDLKYGVELISGVTSQGVFAIPKGDPVDVNLKPYKIVNNGAFVYNPTRLDLGSIAYRTDGLCIVSHLYMVFYLTEEGKRIIDPTWLYIYFRRNEFLREVTFRNFGSQRPEFNFEDMSDIIIPLPDLPTQQKYELLKIFQDKYPEWFIEKKTADGVSATEEELKELKAMPFMAMVASVGSNDKAEMYNYLGGVKNDKRSDALDVAFKQEKSNFHIAIVVDMWITGFDVPALTYMYNDKPLKKHMLIQTISRVNRKYPGKEYGMIIDYIGIRDNMRTAMKIYGGNTSVAPTTDDVEQATAVFREELSVLKDLFAGLDLRPFLNPDGDPSERYCHLSKAAEFVFVSTQEMQSMSNSGKSVKTVSFKTYFLKTVKRMRMAFDICQPSGELGEEESALAQCFMAIAGFVRKMSGTSEVDTEAMNRHVAQMVEEALRYNRVESVLNEGEQEDIFGPEFLEKLSDIKMPASKLELLIKTLRRQIIEYSKTNQVAAKKFQEMLEKTIAEYHERRKRLSSEEAGETQEQASEDIIRNATEQALRILQEMNENRESFRKVGLTFEEKAFYDILMSLRDQYNFEYGEDKNFGGVIVNSKCKALARKIKEIIDTKSSFADWLNNQIVRDQLKFDIKVCLVKNGYPPQYSPEVFKKVMEQVENFEENN